MTIPILKITDGTTEISLIQEGGNAFYLESWRPKVAQFKGGGTFQQSSMSGGRRLVDYQYKNVIESFNLKIADVDPDALIRQTQELRRLLIKAVDYWATEWQDEPVWIEVRASNETNTRYAIIHSYSTPEDENPFSQPFLQDGNAAVMDAWTLSIERGHWMDNAPTDSDCVELSAFGPSPLGESFTTLWLINDRAEYFDGYTYHTIMDHADSRVLICRYNHSTERWEGPYYVADTARQNAHCSPTVTIDREGYIYVFWSDYTNCPANTDINMKKSSSPRDITTWGAEIDAVTNLCSHTYPHCIVTSDNNLALFYRYYNTAQTRWSIGRVNSTDGGATWGNAQEIIRGAAVDWLSYYDLYLDDNGRCHLAFDQTDQATWIHNEGFYIYSDNPTATTSAWYDVTGSGVALPVTNGAAYRVYQQGAWDDTYIGGIAVTPSGTPHIITLFKDAVSTNELRHYEYSGAAWNSHVILASDNIGQLSPAYTPDPLDCDGYAPAENIIYCVFTISVAATDEIQEYYTTDNGTTWTKLRDITTVSTDDNGYPSYPHHLNEDCRILFQRAADISFDNEHALFYTGEKVDYEATEIAFLRGVIPENATCDDLIFVANKQNRAGLTHIFVDDGGVFGPNLLLGDPPYNLLPAVPALADFVYFGIEAGAGEEFIFPSLIFDIGTAGVGYTVTWEYSSVIAPGWWAMVNVEDNTDPGGGLAFGNTGVNNISWDPAVQTGGGGDWDSRAINGVTAFWVRANVATIPGPLTSPVQQNRHVYTVTWPYVELAASEVEGDIPALARNLLYNQWDAQQLSFIAMGLRSVDRGSEFQAYLNLSDQQQPDYLAVTVGTDSSFQDDLTAPTGRMLRWRPTAPNLNTWTTLGNVRMGGVSAQAFYGIYHVYLRHTLVGGNADEMLLRLRVQTGQRGYIVTQQRQLNAGTMLMADFEEVELPGSKLVSDDSVAIYIYVEGYATVAYAPNEANLYDLILLPVDEWAGDFFDASLTQTFGIDYEDYLEVDSLTEKWMIRSLFRDRLGATVNSAFRDKANGPAILNPRKQQRLYVVLGSTRADDSSDILSPQYYIGTVQMFKNQRYLSMRGDR